MSELTILCKPEARSGNMLMTVINLHFIKTCLFFLLFQYVLTQMTLFELFIDTTWQLLEKKCVETLLLDFRNR